jgi:sigma-B regulation protein RsbU (phosphoserine phosphatase)
MEEKEDKDVARQSLIKGSVTDDVDRRLLELSALFEISQLLNSSLNLTSIVDNILLSPMGRLMINKGLFLLRRPEDQFEVFTLKGLSRDLLGKKILIQDLPERPFLIEEMQNRDFPWMPFFQQFDIRLFVPILLRNDVLGVVAYGKKLIGGTYEESEIEFLSSIANIAATSIQNGLVFDELRSVNIKLDKKVQELNTLFDIGKELNATLDATKAVKLLCYGLMGEMMVNRFAVLLRRHERVELAEKRGFADLVLEAPELDALFSHSQPYALEAAEAHSLNAVLCRHDIVAVVPMRSQDKTKGVLLLGNRLSDKGYTDDDLNFVHTLGNQAMISLENAWLFEDSLERKRLEEELELARTIQVGLLPSSFPSWPRCEVYGINISSKQVGGDYFDVIRVDDRRHIVAVADVSGKGIPASLLMSNVQASLLALSGEMREFHRLVERVNDIIHANTAADKFITFFGGVLNVETLEFTYVNAGHNPPYVIRTDGTLQTLEKGGLLLGMMAGLSYEYDTVVLKPGEAVVMFTDGVTEAMNTAGEQFEEARLEALLKHQTNPTAAELTTCIAEAVKAFAGNAPQSDDITVVVIKAKR